MPDDSNWKTPIASPRCEHLVGRLVVERDRLDVEVADELDRLVDHVEVAQAEEVDLQQAELLDVAHRELGDDLLSRGPSAGAGRTRSAGGRRSRRRRRGSSRRGRALRAASRGRRSRARAGRRRRPASAPGPASGCRRGRPSALPGSSSRSCRRCRTGTSSTRPASRTAARAIIVEKVMICATRSRPYFSAT